MNGDASVFFSLIKIHDLVMKMVVCYQNETQIDSKKLSNNESIWVWVQTQLAMCFIKWLFDSG